MYVITGSHFVPLEDKFYPIALVIVRITLNVIILTITNAISKNLPSSGTKWLPIMTYIHLPV